MTGLVQIKQGSCGVVSICDRCLEVICKAKVFTSRDVEAEMGLLCRLQTNMNVFIFKQNPVK